jgi:hypothetical protein
MEIEVEAVKSRSNVGKMGIFIWPEFHVEDSLTGIRERKAKVWK